MKTIDVAGIPFTEKMLTELKSWIVPINSINQADINDDIKVLLTIQSFLLHHWDAIRAPSDEMKNMLVNIDYLRRRLEIFNTIKIDDTQEGGQL